MISRGTTPTHSFTFPFEYEQMENITISYKQGNLLIKKGIESINHSVGRLETSLTQEETKKFSAHSHVPVEIQIKCKDRAGTVAVSDIMTVTVGKLLDEEVM